jgi:hypothetical protein
VKEVNILTLEYYANLSNEILENNTDYIKSKNLIYSFFENKNDNLTLNEIKLRLMIIDSLYSTQMSKRLFGIDDLAEEILIISQKSDTNLINMLHNFLQNKNENNIIKMLRKQYGIDKQGKVKGLATSLLSKYFYFLLKFKFPIFDSLVRDNLPTINNEFKTIPKFTIPQQLTLEKHTINYFANIKLFNIESNINDYNKLDNLCWLYGKINKGSFSLILNKTEYLNLISIIKLNLALDTDRQIITYLKNNISNLNNLFTQKQIEFIKWAIT